MQRIKNRRDSVFKMQLICRNKYKRRFLALMGQLFAIVQAYGDINLGNILCSFNYRDFLLLLGAIIRLNPHLVDHFPPKCGACVSRVSGLVHFRHGRCFEGDHIKCKKKASQVAFMTIFHVFSTIFFVQRIFLVE